MNRVFGVALWALFLGACSTVPLPQGVTFPPGDEELARGVAREIRDSRAHMGVAVLHFESGRSLTVNESGVFELASVFKLPLLVEAAVRVNEGTLDLKSRWPLEQKIVAAGSGILDEFEPGLAPTVRDLLRVMIAISDNTAANMVLDRFGAEAVNSRMRSLGFSSMRILGRVPDREPLDTLSQRWKGLRLGEASPEELLTFYRRLLAGSLIDRASSRLILDLMRSPRGLDRIARYFRDAPGVVYWGKSGTMDGVRNDAGILRTRKGHFIIVCLADRVPDGPRVNTTMAEISKLIINFWSKSLPDTPPAELPAN